MVVIAIMTIITIMMTMTMIPIVVTLVGIVTDISDVHPSKAALPNKRNRVSKANDTIGIGTGTGSYYFND